jgi:putative endonuclease
MLQNRRRGQAAYANGLAAEEVACAALVADGWTIYARRLEVKLRPTLAEAAVALTMRQQTRLLGACEIILAEHPDWGANGVRFDIMVVNPARQVRRITDAFRMGDPDAR